jgi:large subunit ribosomal protein L29
MKKDQLRGLDPTEMQQKLQEIDEQSFRIRFQMSMGQPEGLRKLREMRRERARLLTYLREREIVATAETAVRSGAVIRSGVVIKKVPQGVK